MGDQWSELPGDILVMIEQHLVYYADKFRFRCVCTHWRSSSPGLSQPPWLLWPYKNGSTCGLYHPLVKKVYEVDLPGGSTNTFLGSGYGWVVALQQNRFINVVNPISKDLVPLPPKDTFPDAKDEHRTEVWLDKIAISGNPSSHDFKAAALYEGNRLAYCKVGDKEWHKMDSFDDDPFAKYKDIAFCHEKLYVTCRGGQVLVCDDIVSCPKLRLCCVSLPVSDARLETTLWFRKDHVANSCSDDGLSIILRRNLSCTHTYSSRKVDVEVFKYDMSSSSWTRVGSLGDRALFIGQRDRTEISCRIGEEKKVYRAIDEMRQGINPLGGNDASALASLVWFTPDDVFPPGKLKVSCFPTWKVSPPPTPRSVLIHCSGAREEMTTYT